ncbi:MAG: hypothetical protein ACJBCI_07410 [Candidatus Tisiphia sp.]
MKYDVSLRMATTDLLQIIYDSQMKYGSAGVRRSGLKADVEQKMLDALARVYCFHMHSVCSAVYINTVTRVVLLSCNIKVSHIQAKNVWYDIVQGLDKDKVFNDYISTFSIQENRARTKNIFGYMSVANCQKLQINLHAFQLLVVGYKYSTNTHLISLISNLAKLEKKSGNSLNVVRKVRVDKKIA